MKLTTCKRRNGTQPDITPCNDMISVLVKFVYQIIILIEAWLQHSVHTR